MTAVLLAGCVESAPADSARTVEVSIAPEAPRTDDALVASVVGADGADLAWAWFADERAVAVGDAVVSADATARDETWRVRVTATFAGGERALAEASVLVADSAPAMTSLVLEGSPTVETDVRAVGESTDEDGDAVTVEWAWAIDGQALARWDGPSLPAGTAVRDDVVEVTAVPSDGTLAGEPAYASATIANAVPSVAAATLGVATARSEDVLGVTVLGWYDPDGDAEDERYAWFVDGFALSDTGPELALAERVPGEVVWCEVVPWDGRDEGGAVTTEVVQVVE